MTEDARARARARRIRWAVRLGSVVLRLLAATWRIRVVHGEHMDAFRRSRRPFIAIFWHGRMLPLLWWHRHRGVAILISEHGDGEIIAQVARSLGYALVRGSSTRGGERALLEMIREASSGTALAITPDGPRGPAESFAPGAVLVAHRSGVPLIPVSASASRAWRLRSWDRFLIPKPFARVTIAYGPAEAVQAASAREAAAQAPHFQAALRALDGVVHA